MNNNQEVKMVIGGKIKISDEYTCQYQGENTYKLWHTVYPHFALNYMTEDNKKWASCKVESTDELEAAFEGGENIMGYMIECHTVAGLFLQWFIRQPAKVTNIKVGDNTVTVIKDLTMTEEDRQRCIIEPLNDFRKTIQSGDQ